MTHQNSTVASSIPFIDLHSQRTQIEGAIDAAISRVLQHGQYILGPEVSQLEAALAEFCGVSHVVSCASGTDALALVLMAKNLRAGQAVICPSFTFAATAEAIAVFGGTPIFVDVDPITFSMDPLSMELGIAAAKAHNLEPVGVIVVDLFGQPAPYDELERACEAYGLWLLADAAQSFGSEYKGRKVGTIGFASATSFFPSKPLGCYGDGGAIFTDNADFAVTLRSLRVHGEGNNKYDNVRIGMNGRLDTIQAAVLLEKLNIFPSEIRARDQIARRYNEFLCDVAVVPIVRAECTSVWSQYTLRVKPHQRSHLMTALRNDGIPTAVYYSKPLHQQPAYRHFPISSKGAPVSEMLSSQVVSLPMHPYLKPHVQDRIIGAVRRALVELP